MIGKPRGGGEAKKLSLPLQTRMAIQYPLPNNNSPRQKKKPSSPPLAAFKKAALFRNLATPVRHFGGGGETLFIISRVLTAVVTRYNTRK